jgi:hypothetical protein
VCFDIFEHVIEHESTVVLPDGLAEMPPGPGLAAVLASIDRSGLSGFDMVVLLRARARQVAFEQAELAADLVAVGACVRRESHGVPWVWDSDIEGLAAAEIAAALRWTRRSALSRFREAWGMVERLPAVWRALHAGLIDLPRAKVLIEGTGTVREDVARRIVDRVLPDAPALTTGQLAHRLRRLILEEDPGAARERYEQGVAERKVVRGTNTDGTGYLSGCNLPVDQAAAADERLDALARAAKQAGDARPIDVIRADIYLALLAGTYDGPGPIGRRGVIELTADLPTLMGLADRPADLSGWGPVIADIARRIADQRGDDPEIVWWYSITDPFTGALLYHGTTRPPRPDARAVRQDRSPRPDASNRPGMTGRGTGRAGRPGTSDAGPAGRPRRDRRRRDRRRPTPRQRAFVIARDRTCRGPGCRAPAHRAEIDHIHDHAAGGPTRTWNLDAKCPYCHDLKDHGWKVKRDRLDGTTTWISALGHTYHVPAEQITRPRRLTPVERRLLKTLRRRT